MTAAAVDFVHTLSDAYLLCRDRSIGHDWDIDIPFQLSRRLKQGHVMIRVARCTRCGTRRLELFEHKGKSGYIIKTGMRYEYPEDYTTTGIGKITNADVWTEQLRRTDPLPMPKQSRRHALRAVS
jgi:hypothetical protein